MGAHRFLHAFIFFASFFLVGGSKADNKYGACISTAQSSQLGTDFDAFRVDWDFLNAEAESNRNQLSDGDILSIMVLKSTNPLIYVAISRQMASAYKDLRRSTKPSDLATFENLLAHLTALARDQSERYIKTLAERASIIDNSRVREALRPLALSTRRLHLALSTCPLGVK